MNSNNVEHFPPRIAVIIPYFGKWPYFFHLFLKGCENNQWLDILFFTDCPVPNQHPTNVYFYPSSLSSISQLASKKLSAEIRIMNGYKLCDLRPFYGLVFTDYLKSYQYWGYGDIDLIYGDLKPFVIPRIEAGFDVLSSRKELLSGSFSLFRNNNFITNLGTRIPNYIDKLRSKKHECLDETGHSNVVWEGGSKKDLPEACFTKVVINAHDNHEIKASFETICKEHIDSKEIIHYANRTIVFNNQNLGYYHFVCNKNDPKYILPRWKEVPDDFCITKTGFYTVEQYKFYTLISKFRLISGFSKFTSQRILKKIRFRSNNYQA